MFTLWLPKGFKPKRFSTRLSKNVRTKELTKTQSAKLVETICCLQLSICPGQRQMGQKNKCLPASCVHLTVQFISLGQWRWPCSYMSPRKWHWLRSRDIAILPALRSYGNYQQRDRADHLQKSSWHICTSRLFCQAATELSFWRYILSLGIFMAFTFAA